MKTIFRFAILLTLCAFISETIQAQAIITTIEGKASKAKNQKRGLKMLGEIKDAIKEDYYDKNLKGIDIEKSFKETREKLKSLEHNWQIFRLIAQFVLQFDDSHTTFYPPGRANRAGYGFTVQMIGAQCFVVSVKKDGDAAAKGIKPGDIVSGIDRYNPTRNNLWLINYLIYSLDPREKLDVFILNSDGTERKIEIVTKFKSIEERQEEAKEKRKNETKEDRLPFVCHSANSDIIACKLKTFIARKSDIDKMMEEIEGHKKLVLDLRGNGGGYVSVEEYLVGHFFDRDVKIGDFVTRKKTSERVAKSRGPKVFAGELQVLIDSRSASAAEVFARVIQLEKRGLVLGDQSAGAVMTSEQRSMAAVRGLDEFQTISLYGLNLTVADLIMSDGNRLEKVGVIPDVPIGPSPNALLSRADPVLAYAIQKFGFDMSQEEAGALNFLLPKDEDEEQNDAEEEEEPENKFVTQGS